MYVKYIELSEEKYSEYNNSESDIIKLEKTNIFTDILVDNSYEHTNKVNNVNAKINIIKNFIFNKIQHL